MADRPTSDDTPFAKALRKQGPLRPAVPPHQADQSHPSSMYDTVKHVGGLLTGYSTVKKAGRQMKGEE